MRQVAALGALVALVISTAGAMAATPPDARSGFVKSCQTQMYLSAAACACLADRASQQLDAKAIAYLSLPALDVAHSTAMAKSMSGAEMAKIDSFMRTAPDQCQAAR